MKCLIYVGDNGLLRWLLGFVFSLGVGQLALSWARRCLYKFVYRVTEDKKWITCAQRKAFSKDLDDSSSRRQNHFLFLLGTSERALFTLLVALGRPDTLVPLLGGWIALKIAIGWQRAGGEGAREQPAPDFGGEGAREGPAPHFEYFKHMSLASLLLMTLSMGIAVLGGLICKADTWRIFASLTAK